MMAAMMLRVIIFIRAVMRVVVVGSVLSRWTQSYVRMRPWATGPAKSYIVGEFGRLIKEGYIDPEELAIVRPVKVLVRAGVVLEAW